MEDEVRIRGRYQEKNCVIVGEDDYKVFTCKNCNYAPFKVEFKSDHVVRWIDDYDGSWFLLYCPYCGKQTAYKD